MVQYLTGLRLWAEFVPKLKKYESYELMSYQLTQLSTSISRLIFGSVKRNYTQNEAANITKT